MKNERILIKEDRELLKKICRDISEYVPVLNELKQSYEDLELGNFTQKIFIDIVKSGQAKILDNFRSYLITQFNNAKISSSIVRSNMIADTQPIQDRFKVAVENLRSFKPADVRNRIGDTYNYLKPHQITYENGRFFVSDENEEAILEQNCRTYLTTERDLFLFEKVKTFSNSYKELKKFLIENNFYRQINHGIVAELTTESTFANSNTNVEMNINAIVNILRNPEIYERLSKS